MRTLTLTLTLATILACSCGGPPADVTFDGAPLKKARSFKLPNQVKGVLYTADGDGRAPEDAPRQVGVMYASTKDMKTPADLHGYILDVYERNFSMDRWLTDAPTPTSACKVGREMQYGRMFVAVHVCEAKGDVVACAEDDQALPKAPCHLGDRDCLVQAAQALCSGAIDAKRPALSALIKAVAR